MKYNNLTWYPDKKYNEETEIYLSWIEAVFRVQHPNGKWEKIKLTSHQREWHSQDIAIKMEEAKSSLVIKSRNTSFTISSIIRLLTASYFFRDQIFPVVRINDLKAKELISEFKKIIKHMQPIQLDNGELWPFDPNRCNLDNVGKIEIKDRGVTIQSYAASATASEQVRGTRITIGLFDECNFAARFNDIYTAMRDAARGADADGKNYFQLVMGSTLKGHTAFYEFYRLVENKSLKLWQIFKWPVFDMNKFDRTKSFSSQDLIPIVPWQTIDILEQKWIENPNTFREEFLCEVAESSEALYILANVIDCIDTELRNKINVDEDAIYYMGVDPAGVDGGDMFSISIIEKLNETYIQRYLYYINQGTTMDAMENMIEQLIIKYNPKRCRIDSNGLGYQIGQTLFKKYKCVEAIRGNRRIKIGKNDSIPFNEFMHTNMLKLINKKEIKLLNNEEQLNHFSVWKNDYTADRELHHGDIIIANGLALLPDNWKIGGRQNSVVSNMKDDEIQSIEEVKQEVKEFHKQGLKDRMEFYKKNKRGA
jgi:hypothetical protein